MRRISGTGLSGLVGSRIVELLRDKFEFKNLDLTSGVDITDYSQLEEKIASSKAKIVIHLAAFTDVDKAWEENGNKEGLCYKVNVIGTRNIAQACKKFNKYLIHFSTDFVFDGRKEKPYKEEDTPFPIEWYGQTKFLAEEEVRKSNCQYVIIRIAFPFKAKVAPESLEPKPKLDLVRKIIKKFEIGDEMKMFSDQIITPTFIDDIASSMIRIIELKPFGIYHCVDSTPISPYQLAVKVATTFGFDKNLIKKTTLEEFLKPGMRPRQQYLALSNEKLEKDFGVKMSTIDEALDKMKDQLIV